jgi:PPOX class probable F420-dependent enzyme
VGSIEQIAARKFSLLVTFRRDGTPVPTPACAAEHAGLLFVRSERSSGKVKRLRNDARLLIAPCTSRGKPLGAPVQASARVLEAAEEAAAERVLASRYGVARRLFELTVDLLRVDMCYLEIAPQAEGGQDPARRRG